MPNLPFIHQARMYSRFAWGLRGFLREPITLDRSREVARERLHAREDNLLGTVKKGIYENTSSPYLKLLQLAGCQYGDFEEMIRSSGIEDTLERLYRAGVYLTLEEFKGNRAIVRGSASFEVSEGGFDVPLRPNIMATKSSATRSAGTRTAYDFEHLSNHAMCLSLMLGAVDALHAPLALWWPTFPGGGPKQLIALTKAGNVPVRWFSQTGKAGSGSRLEDRLRTDFIVYSGRLYGARWPRPEYTPLDRAGEVAAWMSNEIKTSGACCLFTYPSSALRVCQAAKYLGLDMIGTEFIVAGEPYTEAKKAEMESVGSTCISFYAFVEAGAVGIGCLNPQSAGEVHLLSDSFALIQRSRSVSHSAVSVDAFLFTTLLSSAPRVILNTENGDYGLVETSNCHCEFEELGLTTHLRRIRGFDKLTAEGMTLVGTDLVRILEEVLPAKYGCSSTDFQIMEEEDGGGKTRMSIVVSPSVGDINDAELIETVLAGLPRGGITPRVWSDASTFRVKRMRPMATGGGKLMPLHIGGHK
jgi:hypothetical protein